MSTLSESEFRIAAAQIASVRGDIERNIATHAAAIEVAAEHRVSLVLFPELSLTGYEPDLAAELAISPADNRLEPLRALARQHGITAIVGTPLCNDAHKPFLGAVLLAPDGVNSSYCKMHLGTSERDYFEAGNRPLLLPSGRHAIGLAICADTSQPSHPETYATLGANIYAAGVCLNAQWYPTDAPRLADYAARFRMLTLMANHAASIGTYTSVGKSAVWGPEGSLLAQATGTENALLIATCDKLEWRAAVVGL